MEGSLGNAVVLVLVLAKDKYNSNRLTTYTRTIT
jgi:hypothetical protein